MISSFVLVTFAAISAHYYGRWMVDSDRYASQLEFTGR